MRVIRLPDESRWQLETVVDRPTSGRRRERARRRARSRRTYVWVRCVGPGVEFRLMFAATWDLWSEAALSRAVTEERERLAAVPRAG